METLSIINWRNSWQTCTNWSWLSFLRSSGELISANRGPGSIVIRGEFLDLSLNKNGTKKFGRLSFVQAFKPVKLRIFRLTNRRNFRSEKTLWFQVQKGKRILCRNGMELIKKSTPPKSSPNSGEDL